MTTELEQVQALLAEVLPIRSIYIHFITLGVGEGEYVNLVVDSPVK